jgi:hypothetical protein
VLGEHGEETPGWKVGLLPGSSIFACSSRPILRFATAQLCKAAPVKLTAPIER